MLRFFSISQLGSGINVMFSLALQKLQKTRIVHAAIVKILRKMVILTMAIAAANRQNHLCNDCKRQFVVGGQDWFISEYEKALINKLLLERTSLAGICRVMDVSEGWLMKYLKELYSQSPQDLNASLELPDKEFYLSSRFDEEIERLIKKKVRVA